MQLQIRAVSYVPSIHALVAYKGTVNLPQGETILTQPVTASTIGQRIIGQGIGGSVGGTTLVQTTPGARGLVFVSTPDTMRGGNGLYAFHWEGMTVRNASAGFVIGDETTPPSTGAAYCTLVGLCAENCQIGFDFGRAGILRGFNLNADGPGKETAGSIGLRVNGGQPNSIVITGFAFGNVETGVDWSQPGCGNSLQIGDGGMAKTGVRVGSGVQLTIPPGNFEATIDDVVFDVQNNGALLTFGVGGHGSRATSAYNVNDGGRLVRILTGIGHAAGVAAVRGAGFGTTVALEPYLDADTTYDSSTRKWKELPFPSVFRGALESRLPADAAHYGAVAHVIRDSSGNGGLVRVGEDSEGNFFYDWICKEDNPAI